MAQNRRVSPAGVGKITPRQPLDRRQILGAEARLEDADRAAVRGAVLDKLAVRIEHAQFIKERLAVHVKHEQQIAIRGNGQGEARVGLQPAIGSGIGRQKTQGRMTVEERADVGVGPGIEGLELPCSDRLGR